MSVTNIDSVEVSSYVGILFMSFGAVLWGIQFVTPVFTDLSWGILFGGIIFCIGSLFLYSDCRVYFGEQSPTEKLLYTERNSGNN